MSPASARRRAAHIFAGFLTFQAVAAGAGFLFVLAVEGAEATDLLPMFFLVVAILSAVSAVMEWMRHRYAERVATFAVGLSFLLVLAALLAGLWMFVPFVAVATIGAIFGMVDRYTTRDAERHQPRHP